jgi:hypothetical protein
MLAQISTTFNIILVTIEQEANLIERKESGARSPVWNHTIQFHPLENGRPHYTDEIEFQAGLLSGLIWDFAHLFYHHRQRRWKALLRREIEASA